MGYTLPHIMPDVFALLHTYSYWILIPISLIEGPVVAFIAGTLAAAGYFDIYILALLFFISDMGKDGFYYTLGHFGTKTTLAQKFLGKIGVTESHFEEVRLVWEKHPLRTMFFGKLAYGIATGFIVLAGAIRMKLSTFFAYGAIVATLQYGVLLLLGFFFGSVLGGTITHLIQNIQYAIGGITLVAGLYYFTTWQIRRRAASVTLADDGAPPSP